MPLLQADRRAPGRGRSARWRGRAGSGCGQAPCESKPAMRSGASDASAEWRWGCGGVGLCGMGCEAGGVRIAQVPGSGQRVVGSRQQALGVGDWGVSGLRRSGWWCRLRRWRRRRGVGSGGSGPRKRCRRDCGRCGCRWSSRPRRRRARGGAPRDAAAHVSQVAPRDAATHVRGRRCPGGRGGAWCQDRHGEAGELQKEAHPVGVGFAEVSCQMRRRGRRARRRRRPSHRAARPAGNIWPSRGRGFPRRYRGSRAGSPWTSRGPGRCGSRRS